MSTQVIAMTGCASGIGKHLSGVLAAQGHSLLLTDINEAALQEHAAGIGRSCSAQIETMKLDVRDPAGWERVIQKAVERWGRLDVLMNIAGYLKPGWVHEEAAGEVDRHFDINAKGVIFGTQAAARQMVKQRRGHIVNIASMAGVVAVPGIGLYTASKHAVRGFSLAAAQELRRHGVDVTVICPDAVDTPMYDLQKDYKEAAVTFSGPRPLTVKDIEEVIVGKVLKERPTEVLIVPPRSGRAFMAKLVSAFPTLAEKALPTILKRGLAAQEKEKRKGNQ